MSNNFSKNKTNIENSVKNLLKIAEEFKLKNNNSNLEVKKQKTVIRNDVIENNRLGIKDIKRIGDIKRKNKLKEGVLQDSKEVRKILYANIGDMTRDLLKKWINNQLPYYAKKALSNDIRHLIKFHKNS